MVNAASSLTPQPVDLEQIMASLQIGSRHDFRFTIVSDGADWRVATIENNSDGRALVPLGVAHASAREAFAEAATLRALEDVRSAGPGPDPRTTPYPDPERAGPHKGSIVDLTC